jgi:hypothetical protein
MKAIISIHLCSKYLCCDSFNYDDLSPILPRKTCMDSLLLRCLILSH